MLASFHGGCLNVRLIKFFIRLELSDWSLEHRESQTKSKSRFPELRGGKKLKPRKNPQLKKMAEYIQNDLHVDALVLCEIGADTPTKTETI